MKTIDGGLTSPSARIAIVVARFNSFINQHLLDGALSVLQRVGQIKADNITVVWVPGAYEIPLATKMLAESGKFDGIVALGTVIRGETAHFDFVAGESSSGLLKNSLEYSIPIGFGILTTETTEQAIERAGNKAGNKGADAALAVVEMVNVLKAIKG